MEGGKLDFLKGLNEQQTEAVVTTEGPLLILAGAGSGKTRVITHKIAYLIREKNVFPSNILAITFTNKAANEMKERTANLLNEDVDRMWIGTFHSICLRILRRDIDKIGYTKSFSIYDRDDQITVVKDCLKELNLSNREYNENMLLSRMSDFKNRQIDPDVNLKENFNDFREKNIANIYKLYQKKIFDNNAVDFDDILCKTVELLDQEKDILEYYQDKFEYVFIDEYQDTNNIQYVLAKQLSGKHQNICVVGDIDQSIYGWRGADISNIMDFSKDFEDSKEILLERNYRSTQKILDVANSVIKNNYNKAKKNLWTDLKDGADVEYHGFERAEEEADFVVSKIKNLIDRGSHKPSDIAILYRANAQSRNFEDRLVNIRVPYKVVGGLRFYDRKEIKDVLGYLKILQNPKDDIALKRIINTPKRGIGLTTVSRVEQHSIENNMSMYETLIMPEAVDTISKGAVAKLKDFMAMINILIAKSQIQSLTELIESVLVDSDYKQALVDEDTIESRTRIENIEEFLSAAREYENSEEDGNLEDFLSRISLLSEVDKTVDNDKLVTLQTIHSAKGLEYPVVFVVGLEEGQFPTYRAIDSGEEAIEEERRLCYVAVTRAEQRLYLTSAKIRMLYGRTSYNLESRFIKEMGNTINFKNKDESLSGSNKFSNSDLFIGIKREKENNGKENNEKEDINKEANVSYKLGDKVKHKAWGIGMVVEIKDDGKTLKVAFDGKGLKQLAVDLAPIEKL